VERLLVQRKYVIKLGDLGHCCRIDEKSQFQVRIMCCSFNVNTSYICFQLYFVIVSS
jgi:hypothetical protein